MRHVGNSGAVCSEGGREGDAANAAVIVMLFSGLTQAHKLRHTSPPPRHPYAL